MISNVFYYYWHCSTVDTLFLVLIIAKIWLNSKIEVIVLFLFVAFLIHYQSCIFELLNQSTAVLHILMHHILSIYSFSCFLYLLLHFIPTSVPSTTSCCCCCCWSWEILVVSIIQPLSQKPVAVEHYSLYYQ